MDDRCSRCEHLEEHHELSEVLGVEYRSGCFRSDPGAGWYCECPFYMAPD